MMNKSIKIASWNVNSIKVRLNQVLDWFETENMDVLAIQETKVTDENFPIQAFQERGLCVLFSGQKTYNGMAMISRNTLKDIVTDIPNLIDPQRRILTATMGEIRIINLYVPNGSMVGSEKYQYKLDWLHKITAYIRSEMSKYEQLVVLGDFNIAPEDIDVHDPAVWAGSVLVSPSERTALNDILKLGLHDVFRQLHPNTQQFSWWDYRAASFRRNRGLRIDLILTTEKLRSRCQSAEINPEPRKHIQPSDHTPVMIELSHA